MSGGGQGVMVFDGNSAPSGKKQIVRAYPSASAVPVRKKEHGCRWDVDGRVLVDELGAQWLKTVDRKV